MILTDEKRVELQLIELKDALVFLTDSRFDSTKVRIKCTIMIETIEWVLNGDKKSPLILLKEEIVWEPKI